MTEGNIASWRVKEGDSFAAGDVLLEIETDKATMDVEAQDDGILMKILSGDGTKGIKVGSRIAVTAEPGDDISALEMPSDEPRPSQASREVAQSPSKDDTQQKKGEKDEVKSRETTDATAQSTHSEARGHDRPSSVAVNVLLHQHGLSASDLGKITATGPKGRLLKGDILAYLGKINKDSPAKIEKHLSRLAHLDLSNIQIMKQPAKESKADPPAKAPEPAQPEITELSIPISLSAVITTQKRVQDTLGIFLPLSTFINRASELANEGLPMSKHQPTADDLFNAVLGLDQVPKSSRGDFFPNISGITPSVRTLKPRKQPDIIDLLAPKQSKPKQSPGSRNSAPGISPAANIFSVLAESGEERRAEEYLERMKLVLEQEPGRLVL